MKRHTQFTGIRNWYGGDLIDLQAEPLKILDGFFSEFGSFILSGCRITQSGAVYNVSPGIVALQGKGPQGEDVRVVAPFEGADGVALPLYLTLKCETLKATYVDGNLQPVAYVYKAAGSGVKPGVSHVELSATSSIRFNDVLQDALHQFVTDTERTLWNGKETTAGAQAKADDALAKAKTYADGKETSAGAQAKADDALAKAKKYTNDALANLVNSAPAALDTLQELANALGNDPNFATTILNKIGGKVDKVTGKGLSTNDFTDAYIKRISLTQGFDYVIDSDTALDALHNNTTVTTVLIRRGSWKRSGTGITIKSNVVYIYGEEGSELVFENVSGGACLYGARNMENVTIRYKSTNSVYGFDSCSKLCNCHVIVEQTNSMIAFISCNTLRECSATFKAAGLQGTGFLRCVNLYNCGAAYASTGYGQCDDLIRCNAGGLDSYKDSTKSYDQCNRLIACNGGARFRACTGVLFCDAYKYVESTFSREYSAVATPNDCANTLNGGWNRNNR